MTFPETIKKLRIEKGWTQSKLAKLAGVKKQRISALELEYYPPSKRDLSKLSKVFNVSIEELGEVKNHRNKYNDLRREKKKVRQIQIAELELKEKKCLNQRCMLNCNCLCQSIQVTNGIAGCKSENLITKEEDKKYFINLQARQFRM